MCISNLSISHKLQQILHHSVNGPSSSSTEKPRYQQKGTTSVLCNQAYGLSFLSLTEERCHLPRINASPQGSGSIHRYLLGGFYPLSPFPIILFSFILSFIQRKFAHAHISAILKKKKDSLPPFTTAFSLIYLHLFNK